MSYLDCRQPCRTMGRATDRKKMSAEEILKNIQHFCPLLLPQLSNMTIDHYWIATAPQMLSGEFQVSGFVFTTASSTICPIFCINQPKPKPKITDWLWLDKYSIKQFAFLNSSIWMAIGANFPADRNTLQLNLPPHCSHMYIVFNLPTYIPPLY